MKKSLQITIFIVSSIAISSITTIVIFRFIPAIKNAFDSKGSLDTFIFILTLIVAVLAFMFAFIGYNEFTRVIEYRKKVDDFESDFNKKLETYKQNMTIISDRLTKQGLFINQSLNYLNSILAELSFMSQNENTIKRLLHDSKIAQLYRINLDTNESSDMSNSKFDAFAYLEENGTKEDIPHLNYVAEYDPIESNRDRAREIIGVIKRERK